MSADIVCTLKQIYVKPTKLHCDYNVGILALFSI